MSVLTAMGISTYVIPLSQRFLVKCHPLIVVLATLKLSRPG